MLYIRTVRDLPRKPYFGLAFIFTGTLTAIKNKHCFSFLITDKYLSELGCNVPDRTVCSMPWAGMESNQIHMFTLICMPFCPGEVLFLWDEQPFLDLTLCVFQPHLHVSSVVLFLQPAGWLGCAVLFCFDSVMVGQLNHSGLYYCQLSIRLLQRRQQ